MSVTLMLRPSAASWWIAGTHSAVAGTLTNRLEVLMRSCSERAILSVPSVSCAIAGATSKETKPSVPLLSSWTPRSTASASMMSAMTSSQYAPSMVVVAKSDSNCSS